MTTLGQSILRLLFVSLLSSIAACGGGGGGGGGEDQPAAVSPTDPSTVNFIPHLSSKEKVALEFPDTWDRQDSSSLGLDSPEVVAVFREPAEGSSDRFLENVLLLKVDTMADVKGEDVTNVHEISSRELEVAGFPGEESIFDADVAGTGDLDLRFMSIAFEFEGAIYSLLYSAERHVFDRDIEIVRHMAASLNVGQAVLGDLENSSDYSNPGKPAVASDGSGFLVVSCRQYDEYPNGYNLIGRVVNDDRTMGPEFLIHTDVDAGNTACSYTRYSAIFDGTNYLVTYMTYVDGNRRIAGKRITTLGHVIDGSPIDISRNPDFSAMEPDLLFDGRRTLVVWSEFATTRSVKGAFVDPNGDVTNSFVIADNLSDAYPHPDIYAVSPHIAYSDNQFMVIWSPFFFDDVRRDFGMPIFGQLVDLNGNLLLAEAIEIRSDNGGSPRYPQIASDGTNYVVGWIEGELTEYLIGAGSFTVYARQINPAGELVSSGASDIGVEISPPVVSEDHIWGEVPKSFLELSYLDGNYLFLWSSYASIYGVKVSQNLETVSESLPVVGHGADTIWGDLLSARQPNVSSSDSKNLVLWSSQSGELEGWFIDLGRFD